MSAYRDRDGKPRDQTAYRLGYLRAGAAAAVEAMRRSRSPEMRRRAADLQHAIDESERSDEDLAVKMECTADIIERAHVRAHEHADAEVKP